MKPEEFENQLSAQPLKRVPGEWRAEILAAARAEAVPRHSAPASRQVWLAALAPRLAGLLWPHPKAWAGLAAVWVVILITNLSLHEALPAGVGKPARPSPELAAELRQQRKMLAELIDPAEAKWADRQPLLSPKPRSERGEIRVV